MRYLTLILLSVVGCSSEQPPEPNVDQGIDSSPDAEFDFSKNDLDSGPEMDPSDPNRFYAFAPDHRVGNRLVGVGSWERNESWGYGHMVVSGGPEQFLLEKVLSQEFLSAPVPFRFESIPWKEEQLMVTTPDSVVLFDGDLKMTSELELSVGQLSLHGLGNQAVVFGTEQMSFVESTLLGLSVTKELSLDGADYITDYVKPYAVGRQLVHEGILYDIAAVDNRKTLVAAWDLNASDSESAYLGASETADVHNTNWSASPENQRIFVSSDSVEIAVFTMSSPPKLEMMWDVEHLMLDPTGSFSHTISGDWLILTFRVPGRDDRAYYVLDASASELTCLGKIADGEFNLNGQDPVGFTGIGDEIFVSYGESDIIDNVVNLRSMRRSDFQLVDCEE